jgi:hypothetical protein
MNEIVDADTGEVLNSDNLPPVAVPPGSLSTDFRTRFGTLALAQMPDEEFDRRLEALKKGADRVRRIKKDMMTDKIHFGVVPGVEKPSLGKPGAEVLAMIYSLAPSFRIERIAGDGINAPPVLYNVTCRLHLGSTDGPVIAEGVGSANSWERKYRYRDAERTCPKCGVSGTIIPKKNFDNSPKFVPGWLCWAKRGGCGTTFAEKAPEIVQQQVGKVDNPDPLDLDNTLLKMAKKRAYVDATLTGTASSDLFTQDLEDGAPGESATATPAPTESAAPAKSGNAPPPPRPNGSASGPYTITEKQRKLIYARAKAKGLADDELRELVKRVSGKDHSSDLTKSDMDQVLIEIDRWRKGGDLFAPASADGACSRADCGAALVEVVGSDGAAWSVCPEIVSELRWTDDGSPTLEDASRAGHTVEPA